MCRVVHVGLFWMPLWGYRYISMPYGWMFWGGVCITLLWILLFVLFLSLLFVRRPWRWCSYFDEDPLEILKRRYAPGEITREEYERMREDLKR